MPFTLLYPVMCYVPSVSSYIFSFVSVALRFPNCVLQDTGILQDVSRCCVEKQGNQKNDRVCIKTEFSVFDHSLRYCSYKNFYMYLSFGY